jgi:hypothetical protein
MYLLLEHGDPKSARFYEGGHKGPPAAIDAIVSWVRGHLAAAAAHRSSAGHG